MPFFVGTSSLDSSVSVLPSPTNLTQESTSLPLFSTHGISHLAVIMDGNRRYGKQKYGNATMGHRDGGQALAQCIDWCMEAQIATLTVYAFSTENWKREPAEIDILLALIEEFSLKV